MAIKKRKGSSVKNGKCKLAVDADMSIYSASQNHQELSDCFDQYDQFEIDLSAVEEIDCSGIQLLLAFRESTLKASKQVTLTKPSDPVSEVMGLLDIKDRFDWSE
ncbi:MAG: STAS domain-containing protein [Gammaproteobacteria bacterium]|nr:STAS domain-containing protein [Gammaproteobacteria bacterium]